MTMLDIMRMMERWLLERGLPTEGVAMVLEFPSKTAMGDAHQCIRRETDPHALGPNVATIETISGMAFRLRVGRR